MASTRGFSAAANFKAIPKPVPAPKPKAPTVTATEAVAISLLSPSLRPVAKEIMLDPQMNELGKLFMERVTEFSSPVKALLAGIALHPPARARMERHLDDTWARGAALLPGTIVSEVIIGGGLHAAIYAAVRVATGHQPPLVLDGGARVGGAFACSIGPSFFLNSRNRPGELSIPGDKDGSLNFLPGSNLQPSDLGGAEYQTNDMMAWNIRIALAQYARVFGQLSVNSFIQLANNVSLRLSSGQALAAKRVIIATGLQPLDTFKDPRVLSFAGLMKRVDGNFPLRGLHRVAVIGAGDSGKTAIEMLTGQGPAHRTSLAALDYPERIDWYGCPQQTRKDWVSCQRSRYRGIGRFLPLTANGASRIRVKPKMVTMSPGYGCVYVDETPYDHVIDCRGYAAVTPLLNATTLPEFLISGRRIGRNQGGIIFVGPAAQLGVDASEVAVVGSIPENSTSIFRYASRTAALAASLA